MLVVPCTQPWHTRESEGDKWRSNVMTETRLCAKGGQQQSVGTSKRVRGEGPPSVDNTDGTPLQVSMFSKFGPSPCPRKDQGQLALHGGALKRSASVDARNFTWIFRVYGHDDPGHHRRGVTRLHVAMVVQSSLHSGPVDAHDLNRAAVVAFRQNQLVAHNLKGDLGNSWWVKDPMGSHKSGLGSWWVKGPASVTEGLRRHPQRSHDATQLVKSMRCRCMVEDLLLVLELVLLEDEMLDGGVGELGIDSTSDLYATLYFVLPPSQCSTMGSSISLDAIDVGELNLTAPFLRAACSQCLHVGSVDRLLWQLNGPARLSWMTTDGTAGGSRALHGGWPAACARARPA
eukprot:3157522-Amphidinium_carterae.1